MMATEVRSGDLNSGNSSRLEVSIDGLTLSPDPEGDQEHVKPLDSSLEGRTNGNHGAGDGEDGEEEEEEVEGENARSSIERKWGFSLDELYGLALTFFKEKDGKAFHPTYEEKLRLVALHKQVLLGPYNPDASPEVGFFDVLGNDRRREWALLGSMEKEEAMVEFVKLLNKCCHLFAPFVTSHRIEREEQERKRREEEERLRREEEERERAHEEEERRRRDEEERLRREEEERRQAEDERLRVEQQKQQIMAALNAQTSVQFQQYAAQQYPDSPDQQLVLIRQLQEQHYQQYMQQLYQVQLAQQQAALQKQQQQLQEEAVVASVLETSETSVCSSAPPVAEEAPTLNGQAESTCDSLDKEPDLEPAEEITENGPTADSPAVIAAPSMWTRP
ncbi:Golgi resident protein GCP60, partial [Alosa pseudoharengus]|uniref:Golgi resident protein GCP60 n=1 Tax=Alosa pseudoharengus TaxID=34774 RepID=UPI003F896B9D